MFNVTRIVIIRIVEIELRWSFFFFFIGTKFLQGSVGVRRMRWDVSSG